MKIEGIKVAYMHGRPGSHPMQQKSAQSIGAVFHYVDFRLRWQDIPSSPLRRYLSWIVCALTFPEATRYNVFLSGGAHFPPVLMKMLGKISRKQKIIAHLGDHSLYFLYSGRISSFSRKAMLWQLKQYDALICEGKMGAELVNLLLGKDSPRVYTVATGILNKDYQANKNNIPSLKSKDIIFMGHGPSGNRLWYKGLDLMLDAFGIAFQKDPELTFTIVGTWEKETISGLLHRFDEQTRSAIYFTGATDKMDQYLTKSSLYLHCARGEAFGITALIAMLSGLPALVSEWTGVKEVVGQVSEMLIVPLDPDQIAARIHWYFDLSDEQKFELSERSRNLAKNYTEERAINEYIEVFAKIVADLKIG